MGTSSVSGFGSPKWKEFMKEKRENSNSNGNNAGVHRGKRSHSGYVVEKRRFLGGQITTWTSSPTPSTAKTNTSERQ